MIWHRYSEKRPKAESIVWVLTKRLKKPQLRRYRTAYERANPGEWSYGGRVRPNDLWCAPECPPMPKER